MSELVRLPIAVDALGGDNAPEQIVHGAVDSGVPCILVGPKPELDFLLGEFGNPPHISVLHAEEAVGMDESPVQALRTKRNSTMMVSIGLVKERKASGVMSAGNTGAFVMGATMSLGRIPGVVRPAAAIPIPNPKGYTLLLDAGAAADCTAADLVNFAIMGSTYARTLWGIEKPRVALLSIGEEESKGRKQVRQAHELLKQSDLNFIGNVEGSDLGKSVCDVMVVDGFTGNVALKVAEGMAILIMQIVKDQLNSARGMEKIASLLLRPLFRRVRKRLDWQEVGGGPMLGISGNVVIAHGKSKHRAVSSAIRLAHDFARTDLNKQLEDALREHTDIYEAAVEMNGEIS